MGSCSKCFFSVRMGTSNELALASATSYISKTWRSTTVTRSALPSINITTTVGIDADVGRMTLFIPRIGSKAYQAIMSFGSTEFQLPLSTGLQMGSESIRGAVLGSSCLRHERLFTAAIFSVRLSLTHGACIVTDVTSAVVLYQRATVRRGDRILDCGSHIGSRSLLALQIVETYNPEERTCVWLSGCCSRHCNDKQQCI